jgi:hypothetical protein
MNPYSEPIINSTNYPTGELRRAPRFSILCVIGLLLITASAAVAQTGLSVLRGTVNDQSGAVVPGADISVTELATNIKVRTIRTDSNGGFEIPDLKPGSYRLRAEKIGFKLFVADDLLLDSGQIRRVDIVLQVGGAAEPVSLHGLLQALQFRPGFTVLLRATEDAVHPARVAGRSQRADNQR